MCEPVFTAFGWPEDGNGWPVCDLLSVLRNCTLFPQRQHCFTTPGRRWMRVSSPCQHLMLSVACFELVFVFQLLQPPGWVWCFNDWWYLCPFWGIYVLSFNNISRLLVVLWMFSIFILVLKYLKHFMCVYVYGCLCVCMSVCVFVYVCLCVWALMFMCAYGFHSFGPTVFSW